MEDDSRGAAVLKRNMDDRMQELQSRLAKIDADDDTVASLRAEWEEYQSVKLRQTARQLTPAAAKAEADRILKTKN